MAQEITPDSILAKKDDLNLQTDPAPESIEALENLAAAAVKEKTVPPVEPVKPIVPEKPVATAGDVVPAATPDPAKVAADAAATAAEEVRKAEEAKQAEEAADRAAAAADPFTEHQLPEGVKPKSAQAFENLKVAAREKVAEVAGQLTTANTELSKLREELDATKKLVGKLSPETEQELTTLRNEHAMLDVQNAPEIKKFDADAVTTTENIYKKLLDSGVVEQSAIDKIKELGGPAAVDWEPILEKLTFNDRQVIGMLLTDIERAKMGKEAALKNASSKAGEFLAQRTEQNTKVVRDHAMEIVKTFPWMALKEVPANATAVQKQEVDSWNASQQLAMTKLNEFLGRSGDPTAFAELAVGTVLAYQYAARYEHSEKAYKESSTALAAVTKERDELKAKIEAIKKAQVPRNRGDAVVPAPATKKSAEFETTGTEALDNLAKGLIANRPEE